MRCQIGGGVPDAPDPLAGMDLLDEPTGIGFPEQCGVDPAVAKDVEVRGELPLRFLLTPGMEYRDSGCGTVSDHGVVDMPAEVVELRLGLAEPLDQFLRRGDHPVADVPDGDALLLAEDLVREELLLDLDSSLEGGVVHALRTSEAPTMSALALAVMIGIVGTSRVHYASGGGADESASLPVGTTEVVGGHAP